MFASNVSRSQWKNGCDCFQRSIALGKQGGEKHLRGKTADRKLQEKQGENFLHEEQKYLLKKQFFFNLQSECNTHPY